MVRAAPAFCTAAAVAAAAARCFRCEAAAFSPPPSPVVIRRSLPFASPSSRLLLAPSALETQRRDEDDDGRRDNAELDDAGEASLSSASAPMTGPAVAVVVGRRSAILSAVAAFSSLNALPPPALADDAAQEAVEMKSFVDPEGLFFLNVPQRFYTLRRKAKGDLPDERTGKGRRGSSIFTAGDMAKAEVVAVERFPTAALLEEAGIVPTGDLSTFPSIGTPTAVAELINARRERERQQGTAGGGGGGTSRTNLVLDSAQVSPDGKTLTFNLRTKIDVQKPELLLEQQGVSELYRVTLAKCTLDSNDGNIMAVFASAIETDFRGADGEGLRRSVESFRAIDRSGAGAGGGGGGK